MTTFFILTVLFCLWRIARKVEQMEEEAWYDKHATNDYDPDAVPEAKKK